MKYTLHQFEDKIYKDSDEDIFDEYISYPEHEQLLAGVPVGYCYFYVSNTYLNGFINYVKHRECFVSLCHCVDSVYRRDGQEWKQRSEEEIYKETIQRITEYGAMHTHLGELGCHIIHIGELEDSWVIFEYEPDVSDCSIGRVSKEKYSREDIVEYAKCRLKHLNEYHCCGIDEYIELSGSLSGWVKF